ncbi:hypothetical protein [Phascolarctobacterium faecium]|uniref:hypothetical protein n=1 Tax=Phascolarctobacterium faecium TaxID=33025 RepID=UPI003A92835F
MAYMYFAKVNVNEEIFEVYEGRNSLKKILDKLIYNLSSKKIIVLPQNKGRIKFITLTKNIEKQYVTGRIVKIFKDDIKTYDPEEDDVKDLPTDKLARSATFYFDVQHEMVAFTTGQYFGKNQFCEFFEMLLNEYMGKNTFKVFLLKDEDTLREKLQHFSKISKIWISIVPKNPGCSDIQNMYANPQAIEDINARIYTQEFKADKKSKDGLNINNKYMSNAINGVSQRYGDMGAEGIGADGQDKTVKSSDDAPEQRFISSEEKNSIPSVHEIGKDGIRYILAKMLRR